MIKKVKALSLLKDLHISVYDINLNGESQNRVHFKDVLKSLLQRKLEEKNVDYKLSSHLDNKMNNLWDKKHKGLS